MRQIKAKKKKRVTGDSIYNLSTHVLSEEEKVILDKSSKSAPPKCLDKFQTFMDVQKYIRKMNIKRYF